MRIHELQRTQWIPKPIDEVFAFFSDEKNLEEITPPWLNFKVLGKSTPRLEKGTLIDYELRLYGFPLRWQSKIEDWNPNHSFIDTQVRGPYRYWHHTHRFRPENGGTLVEDHVKYSVPFGVLGGLLAGAFVKRDLERIFDYRREIISKQFGKN